jgi:hypothetical protein
MVEHAGEFQPPMPVVDTTDRPVESIADEIGCWVDRWVAEYTRDRSIRFPGNGPRWH